MSQSPPPPAPSPYEPPPAYGQPTPPPPYGEPGPTRTSGLAVAALIVGIFGLCVPFLGIVALVLGIIALNRVDDVGRREGGRGMATAGIVLGGVGLVIALLIPLLIGILLPALGAARETARRMQSNTQIRGIHQAVVIYSQGNNRYYPGLDRAGDPTDMTVANRYRLLLDANHFTPEYIVSPSESDPNIHQWWSGDVTEEHYSYAMLSIAMPGSRRGEWYETMNTQAIVMGDRNTGYGSADHTVQSIHTRQPGDWRGGLARNDNSVSYQLNHRQTTRYGSGPVRADDNIFEALGDDDALLIHTGE